MTNGLSSEELEDRIQKWLPVATNNAGGPAVQAMQGNVMMTAIELMRRTARDQAAHLEKLNEASVAIATRIEAANKLAGEQADRINRQMIRLTAGAVVAAVATFLVAVVGDYYSFEMLKDARDAARQSAVAKDTRTVAGH